MLQIFLNTDNQNNTNIKIDIYITNKIDITNKKWINNTLQMKKVLNDTDI